MTKLEVIKAWAEGTKVVGRLSNSTGEWKEIELGSQLYDDYDYKLYSKYHVVRNFGKYIVTEQDASSYPEVYCSDTLALCENFANRKNTKECAKQIRNILKEYECFVEFDEGTNRIWVTSKNEFDVCETIQDSKIDFGA